MKKSQITIFIILGIIMLVIVILFVSFSRQTQPLAKKESATPSDIQPVQVFVQECLDNVAKDAVIYIGKNGGYYGAHPEIKFLSDITTVPYYMFEGSVYDVPSNELVENELSRYVNENLGECLKNFEKFVDLKITKGKISTAVDIESRRVLFSSKIPLEIVKNGLVTELSDFNTVVDADLLKMLDSAREYMMVQKAFPNAFAIDTISNIMLDKNLTFLIARGESPYRFDAFSISFIDNVTRIEDKTEYVFSFGVKFKWVNATANNSHALIEEIPAQIIPVGESFVYRLNSTGENVVFSADTDLFVISSDGVINFTPSEEDAGSYYIIIKATDYYGNADFQTLVLNIVKANTPPKVEPIAMQSARVNRLFSFQINASDNEDELLYYAIENPAGDMGIDSSGLFSWTPDAQGFKNIKINISDGALTTKIILNVTVS